MSSLLVEVEEIACPGIAVKEQTGDRHSNLTTGEMRQRLAPRFVQSWQKVPQGWLPFDQPEQGMRHHCQQGKAADPALGPTPVVPQSAIALEVFVGLLSIRTWVCVLGTGSKASISATARSTLLWNGTPSRSQTSFRLKGTAPVEQDVEAGEQTVPLHHLLLRPRPTLFRPLGLLCTESSRIS